MAAETSSTLEDPYDQFAINTTRKLWAKIEEWGKTGEITDDLVLSASVFSVVLSGDGIAGVMESGEEVVLAEPAFGEEGYGKRSINLVDQILSSAFRGCATIFEGSEQEVTFQKPQSDDDYARLEQIQACLTLAVEKLDINGFGLLWQDGNCLFADIKDDLLLGAAFSQDTELKIRLVCQDGDAEAVRHNVKGCVGAFRRWKSSRWPHIEPCAPQVF